MKTIGKYVALAALASLAVSCIGAEDSSVSEALGSKVASLNLCRNMDRQLRGRGASIWKVAGNLDLLAVSIDGDIVCVDTVDATLDLGLIAIPPIAQPTDWDGMVHDGTPIPAEKFNAAARDHTLRGRLVFF